MHSASNRFANLSPLKQALLAVEDMQARLAQFERERAEPIAIIGMGCRFPHADDPYRFWELLTRGEDAVESVPPARWRSEDYYDANPETPGKMSTRWGGFLDAVDQFDPEFFGISPREAISMDPQQRLMLEVAWEALENAGQGPRAQRNSRTGVFLGIAGDEFLQRFYRDGDLSAFNAYFASGVARSVAGGRVSYTLGLEGPNLSIDTACSSSLVAVHTACVYLHSQECRMALAGGVNVILSPEIGIAFSKSGMMAADGRCKAFDSRADGFVRGEGCGVVVLKRLSDALTDGDRILALIRGSAVNQDGRSSGLTVPNLSAQQSVIRQALAAGSVQPEEVGYVEAHGTGTALGDPIEARALATVLGPGRTQANPLIVGSVKTNLGHLEAAAGIAGLIKTVLSLEKEEIPPHLHFRAMNPLIDWCGMPVQIPSTVQPWLRGKKRRVAGVSAFGFSGTNAHMVLEEAPAVSESASAVSDNMARPLHLLALSARSETALEQLVQRYLTLGGHTENPGDVCHTANAGRAHFEVRLTATGRSNEEIWSNLRKALPGKRIREREGVRAVFLFPDEGAQYAGMGKELFETQPVFRQVLEDCAAHLAHELETPLFEVLWGSATHLLDQTAYTQPALFAVEYALARLWESWGIEPAALLGHGVGEYVAACVAGVYSLADGLKLIAARGRLIHLTQAMEGRGDVAQMHEAFERVAGELTYAPPRVELISSLSGQGVRAEELSHASYWRRQIRQPEHFAPAVESLRRYRVFVEAGPGATLAKLGQQSLQAGNEGEQRLWVPSLQPGRGEWQQMLESLGELYVWGAEVSWEGFDGPYRRRKVALPTYPFGRQRYWIETKPKPSPSAVHELLGRSLDVAGAPPTRVWESRVGFANRPYLADHRALGSAIFPLTGYLEMALAAAGSRAALADIVLREPLVFQAEEDQTVQVIHRGDSIEIFSRHEAGWKQHFTAQVAEAPVPNGDPPIPSAHPHDLCVAMQRMADVEILYALMRRRGMDFGPAFHTIRELWTAPAEVVARTSPQPAGNNGGEFIHPAILDGCFQTIAAGLPEGNDDLYLPARLERFQLHRGSTAELWVHAVRRPALAPNTITFDIRIFDADGPVADARGMEFVRVAACRTIPMFEVRWEAQPCGPAPASTPGDWLILADQTGFGASLAARLSEQGARCVMLSDPGRLKAALAAKDWAGIVHLWSLNASSAGAMNAEALEAAQRVVCGGTLDLVQALAAATYKRPPRLWLVTRGSQAVSAAQEKIEVAQALLWGMANAITEEHPEWRCVRVDLDPIDFAADARLLCAEIAAGTDDQVAFRAGERLVSRLAFREAKPQLEHPKRLAIASRGVLENLQVQPAARHTVPPGCVEIAVDAAGLNFRDVLNVLGMFTGPLGSECAGRISALGDEALGDELEQFAEGDEVIAFASGCHDGYVIADARLVARKPVNLTAAQAAALPTAFLTARYTLEHLAKIRRGDRILIHAAAGGVGLAAVQIAQRAGAEIFATAGSDRKRAFLRELGVRHVMDSRSRSFTGEVLEKTAGAGVDIVLNSLAGDFIAASFSALAPHGRFIEIGKRDVWTAEQVDQLGKGIEYHIADLGQAAAADPEAVGHLLRDCVKTVEAGELRPLPAAMFGFDEAVAAYRHMAQAQHIGKIVLCQSRCAAAILAGGTYLVTGGFGGIGSQLLRWLVQRGARNVVLVGRHDPSAASRQAIEWATDQGARVEVRLADVANAHELAALLSEIASSMPPLRGILHAAGAIDDGVLTEQNWDRFARVLAPKVAGSWLLHELTAAMPLDFFVMFSSIAAILGAPGQANYAAANAFQDALAHKRRSSGLPAMSINWGAWAEGMAIRDGLEERRRKLGVDAMSAGEALRMLDYILLDKPAQVGVGLIRWENVAGRYVDDQAPPQLAGITEEPQTKRGGAPLLDRLAGAPDSRRRVILREHVHTLALRVLGFPPGRRIDFEQPLNELGLDSLMVLEFRNLLAAEVGQNLPSTLLFNYPALEAVCAHIEGLLFGIEGGGQFAAKPPAQLHPLDFVEHLTEEDVDKLLASKLGVASG
jgi:acyl transferase domain-containing protein/NADPH:quinone reductase-like Zn-dependent oxidoreductase